MAFSVRAKRVRRVLGGQLQITDELVMLEQVNRIRDRVRDWREGDTKASIIEFLAQHARSTADDLANGFLKSQTRRNRPGAVRESRKDERASRGYSTK